MVDDSKKGPKRAFFIPLNGAETLRAACRARDQGPQGLFHSLKASAWLHANPAQHQAENAAHEPEKLKWWNWKDSAP